MPTDDQTRTEPTVEGAEPSPAVAYAGAVKMIAPDTLMPQRDRAPYRALIGDDFLRPKVEGETGDGAPFVCDLCGSERQLSDARAHVLKSHTEKFAERVVERAAGLSFIAAHGTMFGDDFAERVTEFDFVCINCRAWVAPLDAIRLHVRGCIPDFDALEARDRVDRENIAQPANLQHTLVSFGQHVEDDFLKYEGDAVLNDLYRCNTCQKLFDYIEGSDLNALGRARRHVRTAHSAEFDEAVRQQQPAGDAVFFGALGANFLDRFIRQAEDGTCIFCKICGQMRDNEELVELRRHVATQHKHDGGAQLADFVGRVEGGQPGDAGDFILADVPRPDSSGLQVSQAPTPNPHRIAELTLDPSSAAAPVFHAKCGGHFRTIEEGLAHPCATEELAADLRVLLYGRHMADESDRRAERLRVRDIVMRVGAVASGVQQSLDNLFALLAEAASYLDACDRSQHDAESRFQQRVKQFDERR